MPKSLSPQLLHRIMLRMGEIQDRAPLQISTRNFLDLAPECATEAERAIYVNLHLKFLQGRGFLTVRREITRQLFAIVELTGHGHEYLQPELAEFGRAPMLPQVVESIESQLQVLSYPQEEKDGLLFRLRESVAKQAPEMFVKIIAEIAVKLLSGEK
jgi:hypothetical protein